MTHCLSNNCSTTNAPWYCLQIVRSSHAEWVMLSQREGDGPNKVSTRIANSFRISTPKLFEAASEQALARMREQATRRVPSQSRLRNLSEYAREGCPPTDTASCSGSRCARAGAATLQCGPAVPPRTRAAETARAAAERAPGRRAGTRAPAPARASSRRPRASAASGTPRTVGSAQSALRGDVEAPRELLPLSFVGKREVVHGSAFGAQLAVQLVERFDLGVGRRVRGGRSSDVLKAPNFPFGRRWWKGGTATDEAR